MVHLKEKNTDKEEGINGEDPDGIKGMTEEVHGVPSQSGERCSTNGEALLSL